MAGSSDRQYVGQYSSPVLAFSIFVQGVLADPDNSMVTVSMLNEQTGVVVFTRAATRTGVGAYQVALTSQDSQQVADYTLTWSYTLGGLADSYQTFILVGPANPLYDNLSAGMQQIVEDVWFRFADLFDSPQGGPNLTTYFQTRYDRGRVAQLLRVAVGYLNTRAQPYMTFSIDGDGGASFPIEQWGSLLEQALYVEVLKHLRRSYVEQPLFQGGAITRVDRRDYMDRWSMILQDEQELLTSQTDVFKIAAMGLSKPAVLVSGGVYGKYGPTRYAGSAAARPRYWARFY